jgi:PAS domain-containing protein
MLWTRSRPARLDYELVFNLMPGMCLVLDRDLTIVAQNFEHAMVSLSLAKDVVGKNVFEAFPENPEAGGMSAVRASWQKVLKTREADVMPVTRYDVKDERGPYQVRWWAITNTPILGEDGAVRWIIHRAEDVTELYELRQQVGKATG